VTTGDSTSVPCFIEHRSLGEAATLRQPRSATNCPRLRRQRGRRCVRPRCWQDCSGEPMHDASPDAKRGPRQRPTALGLRQLTPTGARLGLRTVNGDDAKPVCEDDQRPRPLRRSDRPSRPRTIPTQKPRHRKRLTHGATRAQLGTHRAMSLADSLTPPMRSGRRA
jgi:hypothetical protein